MRPKRRRIAWIALLLLDEASERARHGPVERDLGMRPALACIAALGGDRELIDQYWGAAMQPDSPDDGGPSAGIVRHNLTAAAIRGFARRLDLDVTSGFSSPIRHAPDRATRAVIAGMRQAVYDREIVATEGHLHSEAGRRLLADRLAANLRAAIAEACYGGRMGNDQPGDGWRYRGRGMLQLTGKANYALYGKAVGLDLVAHPDLAADPAVSLVIAAAYWLTKGVNAAIDRGDFTEARRLTNGGAIGLEDVSVRRERLLGLLASSR